MSTPHPAQQDSGSNFNQGFGQKFGQKFGLSVALATPFDAHYKIDRTRTLAHAQSCLAGGCSSITLFGTTGEGASIAAVERGAVIDALIAGGVPASSLVIGVMESAVLAAAAQIEDALRRGCKAILLAPPFYYKNISDDALFFWFSSLFSQVGSYLRDIILYNIPSVTAVELSLPLIARLREKFGAAILGVKDSSGNWRYTEQLLNAHKDCVILIGDERHLARGVRLGGQGAISGIANLYPARLLARLIQGQDDAEISDLVDKLCAYSVTPAIKSMLAHIKADETWRRMRPPLEALDDAAFAATAALPRALG